MKVPKLTTLSGRGARGPAGTRIALIGSRGMLARNLRDAAPSDCEIHGYCRPGFDLTRRALVRAELERLRPHVIINCAAYTAVDAAEHDEARAIEVNGAGPGHLAEAAASLGAVLVHLSSDYIFDGHQATPYAETDSPAPLSAYGRSKLAGEQAVLQAGPERFFIVRTSWLYGPGGGNFVETILGLAREREELRVVADQVGSPTFAGDLANAIYRLLGQARPANGIYHFANRGQCSWHGFATAIVEQERNAGGRLACRRILPVDSSEFPRPAKRPPYSVLDSGKFARATGMQVPAWRDGLAAYFVSRPGSAEH